MKIFNFAQNTPFNWNNKSMVLLGEEITPLDGEVKAEIRQKLDKTSMLKPRGIWGMLKWKDGDDFDLNGSLKYSEIGNESSQGITLKQIQSIWDFNPLSKNNNFKVQERFINFDDINFGFKKKSFDLEDLPELQLTLFLGQEEGAIVYYEHSEKASYNDSNAIVDYILPQKTDSNYSTNRDRLVYNFPILPSQIVDYDKGTGKLCLKKGNRETSFIIKILTYKRNYLTAEELFNEAKNNLNMHAAKSAVLEAGMFSVNSGMYQPSFLGKRKYGLLKYDKGTAKFVTIDEHESYKIKKAEKTLLLIHGTFSSTQGSFGNLYENKNKLLTELIEKGIFEQIIAFDHPTVSENVFENASILYKRLAGIKFEKPVSLLGYSRGSLLTKWLACDKNNDFFNVDSILNFSAANGVGYLKKGNYIRKKLSVLHRMLPNSSAKLVVALAQFSAGYILDQPGFEQMTPGSKLLKKILKEAKYKDDYTEIQAVAADWDRSLIDSFLGRVTGQMLDAVLKYILGEKHDWVVGFEEQKIVPNESPEPKEIVSMHTRNFDLDFVKENTHNIIYDYYKARKQHLSNLKIY